MESEEDFDTDTKLAMLASLLPPGSVPEHAVLLDALAHSGGIVDAAANNILSEPNTRINSPDKKRKRETDLDDWLGRSTSRSTKSTPNANAKSLKPRSSSSLPGSSRSSERAQCVASTSTPSLSERSPAKRQTKNLMDVLHSPPSAGPSVPRLPPLTLSNPSMVKQHTPCTLHPSVLPPELACRLFHTMLAEARDWKRNKWWLFDRLVESPHRTSFFIRDNLGSRPEDQGWLKVTQFWYNGRETDPPSKFPSAMEEACSIIENVVNEEMRTRERLPLEWAGVPSSKSDEPIWRANFAASNLYEGAKEGVGFHSDRLTTLGPYPTIASLSLGTPRVFRLRDVVPVDEKEKRTARTYNIPLSHNSLVIMHATAQERFKHSIPPQNTLDRFHPQFPPPSSLPSISFDPSNCRINITFRFYRPDYHPDTIPQCKCGIPTTLRPDMKMLKKGGQGLGQYRYWWTCAAGDQNEGKGCGFWKVMDAEAEGRGPFAKDMFPSGSSGSSR